MYSKSDTILNKLANRGVDSNFNAKELVGTLLGLFAGGSATGALLDNIYMEAQQNLLPSYRSRYGIGAKTERGARIAKKVSDLLTRGAVHNSILALGAGLGAYGGYSVAKNL